MMEQSVSYTSRLTESVGWYISVSDIIIPFMISSRQTDRQTDRYDAFNGLFP